MAAIPMKKVPPNLLSLTEHDHLPSMRKLRVQVITNSKGYLELNLNGQDLRIVPNEVFQLSATQVLRLAKNNIDYLPMMIAYLRSLKVLDLQHNLLVHLPETLVNCRQLAELQLTANRLTELPKSIGGLRNLRVLGLGKNQFEQLPQEVGQLTSLRILDLHSNKLWHLPFSLQELKHLLQLNISDNMFDHVPLVVTKVTSLQTLNLSRNRLAALPLDFDALKSLRELNLSHNKLASISSMLVTLTHLKYLTLASNGLKFLPSQMSQLQNLRVLHLQDNCLRHVPSLLRRLRYYNVSKNQLTSFSVEGMRSLVSLTASCNELDTVPRGLYKLKQLKFLYLDNNHLVEMDEDFALMRQLRVLDLSNNDLISLPQSLYRLSMLQSFNIKGNYKLTLKGSGKGGREMNLVDYANYVKQQQGRGPKEGKSRTNRKHPGADGSRKPQERNGIHNMKGKMDFSKEEGTSGKQEQRSREYVSEEENRKVGRSASERGISRKGSRSTSEWALKPKSREFLEQTKIPKRRGAGLSSSQSATDVRQTFDKPPSGSSMRDTKKTRRFDSFKSIKDLLFGRSRRTKSIKSEAGQDWDPHATMKTANSLNFPINYRMDEINGHSATTEHLAQMGGSLRKLHGIDAHTEIDDISVPDDTRSFKTNRTHTKRHSDEKSMSHGYGTWTSRNFPLQAGRKSLDGSSSHPDQYRQENLNSVYQHKRRQRGYSERDYYRKGHNEGKLERRFRGSFSSGTTISDNFSFQARTRFGDGPGHFQDRIQSARNSYRTGRKEAYDGRLYRNADGSLNGADENVRNRNDQYSYKGFHDDDVSPRGAKRWADKWHEADGNDRDYSVREARASFATETTARPMSYHRGRYGRDDGSRYSPESYHWKPRSLPASAYASRDHSVREAYASFATETASHDRRSRGDLSNYRPYFHEYHNQRETGQPHMSSAYSDHHLHHASNEANNHSSRYSMRSYKSNTKLNSGDNRHHLREYPQYVRKNMSPSRDGILDPYDSHHSEDEYYNTKSRHSRYHYYDESDDENHHGRPRSAPYEKRTRPLSSRASYISDYIDYPEGHNNFHRQGMANNTQSESEIRPNQGYSFSEFDHILNTDVVQENKEDLGNYSGVEKQNLDNNFIMKRKTGSNLVRSRSVDSLIDNPSLADPFHPQFKAQYYPTRITQPQEVPNKRQKQGDNSVGVQSKGGNQPGGTDYTLLGVCNQIETLLNKDLLQPVIGFTNNGSHRFSEKTIREKARGLWRLGNSFPPHSSTSDVFDSDESDDDMTFALEYSQPQTFTLTSAGGQFVSKGGGPEVTVSVPAHATSKTLHVTIQLLFISQDLVNQVRELNHFVDNIIAIGPVVYTQSMEQANFNSPATMTIPAPPSIKEGHLVVLTVRKDNSCIPCSSSYRSGRLAVTLNAWHFTAKVALITKAKCKYKACKSMEQLLQCIGATQV